jgi:hypothetical protein
MDIQFDGQQVIIPIDKAILVLSRQQFVEALRRGKAYGRRQALAARLAGQPQSREEP